MADDTEDQVPDDVSPDQGSTDQSGDNTDAYNSLVKKLRDSGQVFDPKYGTTRFAVDNPDQFEEAVQNNAINHFQNLQDSQQGQQADAAAIQNAALKKKQDINASLSKLGIKPQYDIPAQNDQAPSYGFKAYDPAGGMGQQQPQAPQQDPYYKTSQDIANAGAQGLENQAAAYQNMGNLKSQQDQANAGIYGDMANSSQQAIDDLNKIDSAHADELEKARQDAMDGHINPNHYMESIDTSKKVTTAIGMLIGGMGSGVLRQENPVTKYVNDQINRDIESQVRNVNQKNTVYSSILSQVGNEKRARLLTSAFQNQRYADLINQKAAEINDPIAKQNAALLSAPLIAKAKQDRGQASLIGLASQGYGPGMAGILTPEQRKDYVPGQGIAMGNADKYKEDVLPTAKGIVSGVDELLDMANTPSNKISPAQRARAKFLATELNGHLSKNIFSKTTRSEIEMLNEINKDPTKIWSLDEGTKSALKTIRERTISGIQDRSSALGLQPARFNPQIQSVNTIGNGQQGQ